MSETLDLLAVRRLEYGGQDKDKKTRAEYIGPMEQPEKPQDGLDPLEVMKQNLKFYHQKARAAYGRVFEELDAQVETPQEKKLLTALVAMAEAVRLTAASQAVAKDLMPYYHRPLGSIPYGSSRKEPTLNADPRDGAIEVTPQHKAVTEAIAKAARGEPPEPRKVL